jgi:hypothetical protein
MMSALMTASTQSSQVSWREEEIDKCRLVEAAVSAFCNDPESLEEGYKTLLVQMKMVSMHQIPFSIEPTVCMKLTCFISACFLC